MDGRATAFATLYEQHYGAVHAYASSRVGADSADEVAAETFLIVWRSSDAVPDEPLPWLYGVTRNVGLRHLPARPAARLGAREAAERERPAPARSDAAGDPAVWEAWNRLRPADREVLALVAWEELSVAEAARVLGYSAPQFSVRLFRARRRLERLLASTPMRSSESSTRPRPDMHPDAITRLRAVNPAAVDPDLGREPVAQAALQRILDSPPETVPSAARAPPHVSGPRARARRARVRGRRRARRDRPDGVVEQQPERGALPREPRRAGAHARPRSRSAAPRVAARGSAARPSRSAATRWGSARRTASCPGRACRTGRSTRSRRRRRTRCSAGPDSRGPSPRRSRRGG